MYTAPAVPFSQEALKFTENNGSPLYISNELLKSTSTLQRILTVLISSIISRIESVHVFARPEI